MKDLYLGHLYTGEGPAAASLRFWTEFFMLISMEEEIVSAETSGGGYVGKKSRHYCNLGSDE